MYVIANKMLEKLRKERLEKIPMRKVINPNGFVA
jgi:hypothetical protein